MSKDVSEKVSREITLLAALDSVHAKVDTSKIAEIQDWTGAVRGKVYGNTVKDASDLSNPPGSSSKDVSGVVLGASSFVASHGSVRYSQMAIPQLIAVCTSKPNEAAWSEFIHRYRPLVVAVIAKIARRFGELSQDLVDDLTQEVYVKLCADNFRALRSFVTARENAFQDFLKVVAINTAGNYFRRAASARSGVGNVPDQIAHNTDHVFLEGGGDSLGLEREILLKEIDKALKTHAHEPNFERDCTIFWLYYSQGFTAKEIAALPDIKLTVKGVESTLLRLTRQIRGALTQESKKRS
jgi:RNA polymerase sigma-70 factor (ECF subfamily)